MNNNTAIIVGGGLGGLFTGAILAKNGFRVTVLEKCAVPGGGLQTFSRHGRSFDAGMHILGGLQPGGNITRICEYLGIRHLLKTVHEDVIDTIHYVADNVTVTLPRGREAFTDYLARLFPENEAELHSFVEKMFALADEVGFFHLRESEDYMTVYSDDFFAPITEIIDRYISNPMLRDILAFISPMYGGRKGVTPAYIHAIIFVLYVEGQGKFVGGARQLTDALCRVICDAGGEIKTNSSVTAVGIADGRVTDVKTADGKSYSADYYISSVHPQRLLDLVPADTFKRAYSKRIKSLPNSYSAFQAFFIMKPGSFPYLPGANFLINKHSDTWKLDEPGSDWPKGLMYITPAGVSDTLVVNAVMPFSEVKQWEGSRLGKRPADYCAWKEEKLAAIVRQMQSIYPDFAEKIDYVETASPLTIRDYFDVPEGSLYGFARDSANILAYQMAPITRIPNLLLTGQCINLHGLCGVPLTAILTVEAILGRNVIVRAINNLKIADE